MPGFYIALCAALWFAWVVSWNVAAFWRARSSAEAPRNEYRLHFVFVVAGFMLVFGVVPWLMTDLLWLAGPALGWAMVALTAAGLAFTWWARIHMGRLWHGGVSRTPDHRVIESGPFALVRHPIYAGLIAAVWPVAVLQARPLALFGAVVFTAGWVLKSKVEERFLERELPEYADYRRRVKMIVPFLV